MHVGASRLGHATVEEMREVLGAPTACRVSFRMQPAGELAVFSDSDFVGCAYPRKSTSATVMRGYHTLRTNSMTQAVMSLSARGRVLRGGESSVDGDRICSYVCLQASESR